jgi:hypothetical protein
MMLITGVSVIRFFKGYATRKKEFNIINEMNGFTAHLFIIFLIYGITYLIINF